MRPVSTKAAGVDISAVGAKGAAGMVGPVEAEVLAAVGSECMSASCVGGEGCNWFASRSGVGGAVRWEMAWRSTAKAMTGRLCVDPLTGG